MARSMWELARAQPWHRPSDTVVNGQADGAEASGLRKQQSVTPPQHYKKLILTFTKLQKMTAVLKICTGGRVVPEGVIIAPAMRNGRKY